MRRGARPGLFGATVRIAEPHAPADWLLALLAPAAERGRWADKALTTIVNGQVVLRGAGGLPPVDGWL